MNFWGFIRQYSVVGLAIGVAIGGATTELIQSIVGGLIRPLIFLLFPQKFETLSFTIGNSVFQIGKVIDSTISFVLIALVIYFTVRYLLRKEELLTKK